MRPIVATPIECGFDWITTTAQTKRAASRLQSLGQSLVHAERKMGNEVRPWTFAGYEGFRCGAAQIGTRHDGTCLRVSGGLANEHWLDAYHAGEGFSRVDLQLTAKTGENASKTIARVYKAALAHTKKRKHGPTCTILKCSNGSSTVYLGKRCSDVFMRCYDKGAETKLDHYREASRFEVELKGAICLSVLRRCASSESPMLEVAAYCLGFFGRRGITLEVPNATVYTVSVPRSKSDVSKKLRWLREQVRPSVETLIACGMVDEVRSCLGLSEKKLVRSCSPENLRLKRVGGK